jgi:hypothetical protein
MLDLYGNTHLCSAELLLVFVSSIRSFPRPEALLADPSFFLSLRYNLSTKINNELFIWKLDPIGTLIRQKCRENWLPSSHLCIDESMVSFQDRTFHTIKIKNKSISEGYKI